MLSHEVMGLLCLGILWVNTLLLAGAALSPARTIRARLRQLRTLRRGAAEGLLARHDVEQTGHRAADDDDQPAILFHDRGYRSELLGGAIALDDGGSLDLAAGTPCEVWTTAAERRRAAACPDLDAFDGAYREARKAKGHRRHVVSEIGAGDIVWLAGDPASASPDAPLVLATHDPRPWCRGRLAVIVGFQLMVLAMASGITWLALRPPLFGTVSTVGAALGLVYFLLIQAVGVHLRGYARLPSQAPLRGSWKRPAPTKALDPQPVG